MPDVHRPSVAEEWRRIGVADGVEIGLRRAGLGAAGRARARLDDVGRGVRASAGRAGVRVSRGHVPPPRPRALDGEWAGSLGSALPFANAVRRDWLVQAEPWLAADAPDAVLWTIPSHLGFWDSPAEFNARLAEFLAAAG